MFVTMLKEILETNLLKKSQSPYRVNMFVTGIGIKLCTTLSKSQSPYRVNMFVTLFTQKIYQLIGRVSIPLSGQYVCNFTIS